MKAACIRFWMQDIDGHVFVSCFWKKIYYIQMHLDSNADA